MGNTNPTSVSTDNANVSSPNTGTPTPNAFVPLSSGKRFGIWVNEHLFGIIYVILLIGLWVYIIWNWDKCISMKFFDQFDGNNILFLLGIILVIMFFYDVEVKDFKFRRRKYENMKMDLHNVEANHQRAQQNVLSEQITNIENEGGNNDEQSR